ncbi:hypothetical protein [Cellvibrio polysaccharolyticus]|uniref:hypothetical protein n=1 Tax=Cellvibrio polysaccharolyticus TaxID=2082724 RepID=UPI00187F827B|nr:hypothetical protein [Cellvibrio polysaccharolyticus]
MASGLSELGSIAFLAVRVQQWQAASSSEQLHLRVAWRLVITTDFPAYNVCLACGGFCRIAAD